MPVPCIFLLFLQQTIGGSGSSGEQRSGFGTYYVNKKKPVSDIQAFRLKYDSTSYLPITLLTAVFTAGTIAKTVKPINIRNTKNERIQRIRKSEARPNV